VKQACAPCCHSLPPWWVEHGMGFRHKVVFVLLTLVDAQEIAVETPLGKVSGVDHGRFHSFFGIPYVEQPRRFEYSQPKLPWKGVLNASRFGCACIGAREQKDLYGRSEDCLYANLWKPPVAHKLPVVVFIHGGAFMSGTGNYATFWGDDFVSGPASPLIHVTFNYRLGIFGFFSSAETGTNFGIHDQQMLLQWVQDNIHAFGGDPSRVTLAGQSAGAMSVETHLVSPGSRGLFHRAFIASTCGLHYRNLSENEAFVASAARVVGCVNRSGIRLDCMRSRPASLLNKAADSSGYLFHLTSPCKGCDNFIPWLPVVDGEILPAHPLDLIRGGLHAKVPVVLSTTRNESLMFIPGILHQVEDIERAYKLSMDVIFRGHADEVERHYASTPDSREMDRFSKLALMVTDGLFTCYARYIARVLLASGSPVFLSTFMHAPSSDPGRYAACSHGATCHAADLHWMFPQSLRAQAVTSLSYTPDERLLAFAYSAAMRRFVHGWDWPWHAYSKREMSSAWDSILPTTIHAYHKEHCDMFEMIGFGDMWTAPAHPLVSTEEDVGNRAALVAAPLVV